MFDVLLPLWEEFCRYRDEAKLADDQLKNTVDCRHQQRGGRRSVKPAIGPQAKDKRNVHPKVILVFTFLLSSPSLSSSLLSLGRIACKTSHVAWFVCLSVCMMVTRVSCAKMNKMIMSPFFG